MNKKMAHLKIKHYILTLMSVRDLLYPHPTQSVLSSNVARCELSPRDLRKFVEIDFVDLKKSGNKITLDSMFMSLELLKYYVLNKHIVHIGMIKC